MGIQSRLTLDWITGGPDPLLSAFAGGGTQTFSKPSYLDCFLLGTFCAPGISLAPELYPPPPEHQRQQVW